MNHIQISTAWLTICCLAGGCTSLSPAPVGPAAVANTVRDEMGRMAIRGPTAPAVSLTDAVDNKGEAAGKTGASAGVGWLSGSMQLAAEAEEPISFTLIAAMGLITAPIVATGGAIYGASAADTDEAISAGNTVMAQTLNAAPQHFQRALERELSNAAPLPHEFVPATATDAELQARGFNTVLDVRMDHIASYPSESEFHVWFDSRNMVQLTSLGRHQVLETRAYTAKSGNRAISAWADDNGAPLLLDLNGHFAEMAAEITNDFFLRPAITVHGIEPAAPNWWSAGTINSTRPMFVWSALDGERGNPGRNVHYEVSVYRKGEAPGTGARAETTRFVPDNPLEGCTSYRWTVRAHYTSFGTPATTDWTPEYRFKTPCND